MAMTPEHWEALTLKSEKPYRAVFLNVVEPKATPWENGRKSKPRYSATWQIQPSDPFYSGGGEKSILRIAINICKEEFPSVYAEAAKAAKANGGLTYVNMAKHLAALGVNFPFE